MESAVPNRKAIESLSSGTPKRRAATEAQIAGWPTAAGILLARRLVEMVNMEMVRRKIMGIEDIKKEFIGGPFDIKRSADIPRSHTSRATSDRAIRLLAWKSGSPLSKAPSIMVEDRIEGRRSANMPKGAMGAKAAMAGGRPAVPKDQRNSP